MVEMQRAEEVPLDFPATEKKRHGLRALLAGAGGKCVRDAGKETGSAGGGKKTVSSHGSRRYRQQRDRKRSGTAVKNRLRPFGDGVFLILKRRPRQKTSIWKIRKGEQRE